MHRIIRLIHRDLGYLAFGLVVIYSISGIAVNHTFEWNPNYVIEKEDKALQSDIDSLGSDSLIAAGVLVDLGIAAIPESIFRQSPTKIRIFFENQTINADISKKTANIETVNSRKVFRETNYLHLNVPKGIWTYVADALAISLLLLAITGLFMIKGKNSITGRGKWLTATGILLPLIYLIIYY